MTRLHLNLRLFDGAESGQNTPAAEPASASNRADEPEKVLYGKQQEPPEDSPPAEATDAAPDAKPPAKPAPDPLDAKRAAFDELVRGEYKDTFGERVQAILEQRFQDAKTAEGQLRRFQPLLQALSQKYGVANTDPDALSQAIEQDAAFFEEAAGKQGLSVEQYKRFQKLEQENSAFRQAQQEADRQRQAQETYGHWMEEERALRQTYPDFRLQTEIQSPDFSKLLRSGVSLQAAYQATHMDELMTGAMQATANAVSKQVASNISARAQRPAENGVSSQGGFLVKNDVSKLSPKDRREIARRAAMGEVIAF